jgi:hypothetical protein
MHVRRPSLDIYWLVEWMQQNTTVSDPRLEKTLMDDSCSTFKNVAVHEYRRSFPQSRLDPSKSTVAVFTDLTLAASVQPIPFR